MEQDGYDALRAKKEADPAERIAKTIYEFLGSVAQPFENIPALNNIVRAVRKVQQELYVPPRTNDAEAKAEIAELKEFQKKQLDNLHAVLENRSAENAALRRRLSAIWDVCRDE